MNAPPPTRRATRDSKNRNSFTKKGTTTAATAASPLEGGATGAGGGAGTATGTVLRATLSSVDVLLI
eukprot:scaffold1042_cov401-Prasinococcus_capsulatus_cf.AAC.25